MTSVALNPFMNKQTRHGAQLAPAEHQKWLSKKKSSAFWQYPTDVGNKRLAEALMGMALYRTHNQKSN